MAAWVAGRCLLPLRCLPAGGAPMVEIRTGGAATEETGFRGSRKTAAETEETGFRGFRKTAGETLSCCLRPLRRSSAGGAPMVETQRGEVVPMQSSRCQSNFSRRGAVAHMKVAATGAGADGWAQDR